MLPMTMAFAAAAKAPTVSITSPANGTSFSTSAPITITANATVSSGTIARVDFYRGSSTLIGTATTSPYKVTWSGAAIGSYSLTAKATSSAGLVATSSAVNITVITQPPVVSLTAPATGSAYTAPATIDLSVNASDPDGAVQRVDFYVNSSLMGSLTSAPYTATWSNVGVGTYTLSAKATDNAGAQTTSSPVTVSVYASNIPPLVAITSPTSCGPFTSGSTIALSADADDPDGFVSRVDFYHNSTLIGSASNPNVYADTRSAFGTSWTPVAGTYTVKAIAYDNKNAATTSTPITLTVVDPSSVSITSPANGATLTVGTPILITATATGAASGGGAIAKVEFLVGGSLVGSTTTSPYAVTWTPNTAGNYTIFARATNGAGVSTNSASIVVTVNAGPVPTVSLTAPTAGASLIINQSASLNATASASGSATIAKVSFYAGATLVGTSTSAPFSATWTPTAVGSYSLTAIATDSFGVSATSPPVNVTVQAGPAPNVSLTSPVMNSTFSSSSTVTFTANAAPMSGGAAIAQVAFFQGGTLIGTASASPYTVLWPSPAAGTYSVTAVATDVLGISATSAPVNFTIIYSPPPSVSLSNPAGGSSYAAPASITLAASASAASGASIAKVDFYQGNTLVGTATAAPYLFTWTDVAAGNYSLTAIATDSLGVQASSPPTTVTVDNLSVAFTSPQDGATVSGITTLVQGTVQAPPNFGVTVNGVVAKVDSANKFYAMIPLQAGSNAITVTVTAPTGQTLTKSTAVSSDGVAPFLSIDASETEGVSPLTVTYTGTTDATVSFDGGSQFTVQAGKTQPLTINYTGIGTIFTTISATNGVGGSMAQTFIVLLNDTAQLDQKLKAVWNGMNTALIAGDKATALNYLSTSARAIYGPVFDALMPFMSGIVASFSTPQMGMVSSDLSEYAVTRNLNGVNNVFFLYLVKDANGVWRLDSM